MNLKRAKKIREEITELMEDFPYVVLEFLLDSGAIVKVNYTKTLDDTILPCVILDGNCPLNLNEVVKVRIVDNDADF